VGVNSLEGFAGTWAGAMWTACWQGGLVVLAVWGVCRLLPKLNPSVRQAMWWLACLKLVLGLVWLRPVALPVLPNTAVPVYAQLASLAPKPVPSGAAELTAVATKQSLPWREGLLLLWGAGLVVTLGAAARSGLRVRKLVREAKPLNDGSIGEEVRRLSVTMGLPSPPRLSSSAGVSAPFVVGHLRPQILVPTDFEERLSAEEQRMALAHELAHVRRRDLWLAIVPAAAYAIFYFFPPVWLACREWAADREASCDGEAIQATGVAPKAYGQLLMKIVSGDHRRAIAGLGATANFNTLKRRISLMARATPLHNRWAGRGVFGLGALLLVPWSLTAPGGANVLISNAGIGEGKYQPSAWLQQGKAENVRLYWDRSVGHESPGSLCISRSDLRYWPLTAWMQTVSHDGSPRSLEFGAWIKADNAHKAVLQVEFLDKDYQWQHTWAAYVGIKQPGEPPANHDWTWYSGVVKVPAGTREIHLGLQNYGGGTVWMDDAVARFVERPAEEGGGR
jgi:beta-lactamase regulating signal transducer with metallopeptidase domain